MFCDKIDIFNFRGAYIIKECNFFYQVEQNIHFKIQERFVPKSVLVYMLEKSQKPAHKKSHLINLTVLQIFFGAAPLIENFADPVPLSVQSNFLIKSQILNRFQ